MFKYFLFIIFIWFIIRIIRFVLSIVLTKNNTSKKENRKRKTGMEIMDADYEEVE